MIELRPFEKLGRFRNDWLNANFHFSFSNYYDPARMGHGKLRVWNDDTIQPNQGFHPHGHRDMEIITYVREGAITHRDSLGNEGRTEAGDVQIMSAGTGEVHSEYNLEPATTKIFQIWIMPDVQGAKPNWGAKAFPKAGRDTRFEVLAGGRPGDAEAGALPINANAAVMAATLSKGQELRHMLAPGRAAYLVSAKGSATVNGHTIRERDAAAVAEEREIIIVANDEAEVVLVEVAA
jgi:redox-sensitive bicupin YhaK (pirin superfamily)